MPKKIKLCSLLLLSILIFIVYLWYTNITTTKEEFNNLTHRYPDFEVKAYNSTNKLTSLDKVSFDALNGDYQIKEKPIERKEKDCSPKCNWVCSKPVCPQKCEPICQKPICTTECKKVMSKDCVTKCSKPICVVKCPEGGGGCVKNECPDCKTYCKPAQCSVKCKPPKSQCITKCKEPICKWECHKPKCPQPKCKLVCEK